MILVTGATGKVGQGLVPELQARGCEFKVMARSRDTLRSFQSQGIPAVVADFEHPEACLEALAGVSQVFLLTVPQPATAALERTFLEACVARGVQHVVRLSALGADPDSASGLLRCHGRCERQLEACGLDWTLLRPTVFMQNLAQYFGPYVARESSLYAPAGEARLAWVDARDVAAVAAAVLAAPGHEGLVYEISGPEAWTFDEVAERLSAHLGRQVAYVDVPESAAHLAMTSVGLSAWLAEGTLALYHLFKCNGLTAQVLGAVERLTGQPPRALDDYLEENLPAFNAAKTGEWAFRAY
jgi:uncharacterized protein YbjT (DUF2867 family)